MTEIKIVDTQAVADFLGVPKRTVEDWRSNGEGPPFRRIGKHVKYVLAEVEEWFLNV